mmetsp:Transcript_10179/g.46636  ORF Transcript_10179/g.46636 Transcript_10179/m.46636 type:complete len:80 (-) Transcript_10179:554-793(-)
MNRIEKRIIESIGDCGHTCSHTSSSLQRAFPGVVGKLSSIHNRIDAMPVSTIPAAAAGTFDRSPPEKPIAARLATMLFA